MIRDARRRPVAALLVLALAAVMTALPAPQRASAASSGPITLTGTETMTIEEQPAFEVVGNITLRGNARLTIRNSNVTVRKVAPRAQIDLFDQARLEVINSRLRPPLTDPANLYLTAVGTSSVLFDHATFYNVANFSQAATITITNGSTIHSARDIPDQEGGFGIVQVCCEVRATVENSEVGSIGLFFAPGEEGVLANLQTGLIGSLVLPHLTITNSSVLPPNKKGPFERGWAIFAHQDSRVTVRDSTLNKFVLQEISDTTAQFTGLKTGQPMANFTYRGNTLQNVSIYNEWGFNIRNANVSIADSDGIWLFLFQKGTTRLTNSTMIEFDPRGFTGELIFDNSRWVNAAEILDGNDFRISGSAVMDDPGLRMGFVWDTSSHVRRMFAPNVELTFDSNNYSKPQRVSLGGRDCQVDFFTNTPLTAASPACAGAGTFASTPLFGASGQSAVVFMGGTVDQLIAASTAAQASGVWVQDASGAFQLLVIGGPAFIVDAFKVKFPTGFPGAIAVTLIRG